MPKELTHFVLSDRALDKVEETCPETGKLLRSNYDLYLLGSIIPDTAYYHLSPLNKKKSLCFLSEKIHTRRGGLESGFLKRALADGLKGSDEAFAFICGLLSHQWADSLFHPFIVHFTGNYSHADRAERKRAQARHRFLEGLIDLKIMDEGLSLQKLTPASVAGSQKAMKSILPSLSLFTRFVVPDENRRTTDAMAYRLDKVRLFQLRLLSLYGNHYFKKLILFVNRLSGNRFEAYAGLLYGNKSSLSLSVLNEERRFKDPWSGQSMKGSVTGLYREAVARLTDSLQIYGKARHERAPFSSALFNKVLPSGTEKEGDEIRNDCLDTGEVDKALRHFLGG